MKQRQFSRVEFILWDDPTTETGWMSLKKASRRAPVRVLSVGTYVGEDERVVRLAIDVSVDSSVNGVACIPKSCIVRRMSGKIPPSMAMKCK